MTTDRIKICPPGAYIYSLAKAFARAFDRTDVVVIRQMIEQEIAAGHRYLVAVEEEEVVGFVSWRPWGEPRHRFAELYHIGVVPGVGGLGSRLVEVMEAAVHSHFRALGYPGARKIFILTHADNRRARLFYTRCGYQPMLQTCSNCNLQHPIVLPEFFREGIDEAILEKNFPEHTLAAPAA